MAEANIAETSHKTVRLEFGCDGFKNISSRREVGSVR